MLSNYITHSFKSQRPIELARSQTLVFKRNHMLRSEATKIAFVLTSRVRFEIFASKINLIQGANLTGCSRPNHLEAGDAGRFVRFGFDRALLFVVVVFLPRKQSVGSMQNKRVKDDSRF